MKLIVLIIALSCATAPSHHDEISSHELHTLLSDSLIIDVRTTAEFQSGHIVNSRHIPLDQLPNALETLSTDRTQPVYFICASGKRSAKATQLAEQYGYTNSINIKDGIYGWRKAGFSLE